MGGCVGSSVLFWKGSLGASCESKAESAQGDSEYVQVDLLVSGVQGFPQVKGEVVGVYLEKVSIG